MIKVGSQIVIVITFDRRKMSAPSISLARKLKSRRISEKLVHDFGVSINKTDFSSDSFFLSFCRGAYVLKLNLHREDIP